MKKEIIYIEFLNKKKNFQKDEITFKGENSLSEAIKWGKKNIDNFNMDMIKFKSTYKKSKGRSM